MVGYILGWMLMLEGLLMLLPVLVSIIYKEKAGISYMIVAVICCLIGFCLTRKKEERQALFAREGFVAVAMSWIVISIFGAIPFILSGEIPSIIDAIFESVSGFTTTGASVLDDIAVLSNTSLFWRSFTHWIGGMGVFILILTVLPMAGGNNMHLMRAELPGPSVGKLVPRIKETAKILYTIYFSMTLLEILVLLLIGTPLFDAITIAFGTAGTGGFAIKNSGLFEYSTELRIVITVFMFLFGVNFHAYYLLYKGKVSTIFKMEEIRWYIGIVVFFAAIITFTLYEVFGSISEAFESAIFHTVSMITTTGYMATDFSVWPQMPKNLLFILMFFGACAGSTAGSIKISRIIILLKAVKKEVNYFIHPNDVKVIKFNGRAVNQETINSVGMFLITYAIIFASSLFFLSFDNLSIATNITAISVSLNNVGLGLELLGSDASYSMFTPLSKIVLMFNMLAGRLELYPILLLLSPKVWKKS